MVKAMSIAAIMSDNLSIVSGIKQCPTCGIVKQISAFCKNSKNKDGLQYYCRECARKYHELNKERDLQYQREYYERNKIKINERHREYYEHNKEVIAQKQCEYSELSKDKIAYRKHLYYERNTDWIARRQCKYYESNKEQICRRHHEYNARNRDKTARCKRRYYARNSIKERQRVREYRRTVLGKLTSKRADHKRRSLGRATEATLTAAQWQKILEMQDHKCNLCSKHFTKARQPTADHILPVSRGGGFTFENVQALCCSCNSSKQDKLHHGFIQIWLALNEAVNE